MDYPKTILQTDRFELWISTFEIRTKMQNILWFTNDFAKDRLKQTIVSTAWDSDPPVNQSIIDCRCIQFRKLRISRNRRMFSLIFVVWFVALSGTFCQSPFSHQQYQSIKRWFISNGELLKSLFNKQCVYVSFLNTPQCNTVVLLHWPIPQTLQEWNLTEAIVYERSV